MARISCHGATKLELEPIRKLGTDRVFWQRDLRIKDQDGETVFAIYADTEAALLTQAERDLAHANRLKAAAAEAVKPAPQFTRGAWALCNDIKSGLMPGKTYAIREVLTQLDGKKQLLLINNVEGYVEAEHFTPCDVPF